MWTAFSSLSSPISGKMQTIYVKEYQRALRLQKEVSNAANSSCLPISNSKRLVWEIFPASRCWLRCTVGPDDCHLLKLVGVTELPCPTSKHPPVTGDAKRDMYMSQPLQIPAWDIGTHPPSPVVSLSWCGCRAVVHRVFLPSWGWAASSPAGQSWGHHHQKLLRARQSCANLQALLALIYLEGLCKAHRQQPWMFMAQLSATQPKGLHLYFLERKWKKNNATCIKIFKATTFLIG